MLKRLRTIFGGLRSKISAGDTRRPPVHRGPKMVHWPIGRADLDPDAVKIVRRLTRFDHKAYLVGGCVRDVLLDRKPKDFDIGTSATPRQMKRLFRNCRIIGRRFRLAHIYFQNGKIIEVATFRARDAQDGDSTAEDQDLLIRDDNVFGTPEEDALRRDFTINSLFYDLADSTVIDHADGLGDLRRKLVRTIGDPAVRFREDPIRILRAIKFAARLDFTIESKTLAALEKTRRELDKAALPRILEEINRFCRGAAARRSFELMGETKVFEVVFPELADRFAANPSAWRLMLDLLGCMDRERASQSREIRTGEILACVLLPLLAPKVGWKDGKATWVRGLNVRALVDDALRPFSLRLRVPRREQENCRQILATLFRMVPVGRTRRNTVRAIVQRECYPDAMWILRELGQRLGGDFAEGLKSWSARTPQTPQAQPAEADRDKGVRRKRQRSRRGRGGKGQRPRDSTGSRETAEKTPAEPARDLPPVWDDDYFFAALPEAPDEGGDDVKTDRYGTSTAEAPSRPAPAAGASTADGASTATDASTGGSASTKGSASAESGASTEGSASAEGGDSTEDEDSDGAPRTRRRRRARRGRRRGSGGTAKPGLRGAPTPSTGEATDE